MARYPSTFGLESMMLVIALVAACMAVARATPVLGVLLSVGSVAALVRTSIQVTKFQCEGRRVSPFDKVIQFFVSVAIVLIIGVPALTSFVLFTVVWMRCWGDPILGFAGGIAAASGVGYRAYRLVAVAIQEWGW